MKDDGGPAFPDFRWKDGMSLRDWFAGMAITAAYGCDDENKENIAAIAYGIADAMLAARKGESEVISD